MVPLSRQSEILDKVVQRMSKKSFAGLQRVNMQIEKEDPFFEHATPDVWFIVKGKLIKNKSKSITK